MGCQLRAPPQKRARGVALSHLNGDLRRKVWRYPIAGGGYAHSSGGIAFVVWFCPICPKVAALIAQNHRAVIVSQLEDAAVTLNAVGTIRPSRPAGCAERVSAWLWLRGERLVPLLPAVVALHRLGPAHSGSHTPADERPKSWARRPPPLPARGSAPSFRPCCFDASDGCRAPVRGGRFVRCDPGRS